MNYIEVFNKIEKIGVDNGLFSNRFTRPFPKYSFDSDFNITITENEINYIHVYDEDGVVLSVFYDEWCTINTFLESPHYELYDGGDVIRFSEDKEGVEELLVECEKIIKNK